MARLIEVQTVEALPPGLTVRVGDLLLFRATGGRVVGDGNGAVDALGAFQAGSLDPAGGVLEAMGGPDAVVFLARRPGRARLELATGDPWHRPRPAVVEVAVEP
jgi:hypothetical protein